MRFTLDVHFSIEHGYMVKVDCDGEATGLDAVAAIRALVDQTAHLSHRSPEAVLGMVEKQMVAKPVSVC